MTEEKQYPFEFSVVMAVYNVEPFLREAVDSLIGQDFGFEKIQLIMVDDGSTDASGAICDEYAAQYPDNVIVVHKENGGVASARNEGLKRIEGRIVNFMDPDDKLSKDTLVEVYKFFVARFDETDVVSIPLVFFDGAKGQHPLNWKFKKGTRVIDLYREYTMVQLSIASTFIKSAVLEDLWFDERLSFAEDAKLLQRILLSRATLGVVSTARYYYRKRATGELSAIQKSQTAAEWYLPCVEFFMEETIKEALRMCGCVPKFIQYTIAYDLQWRLKQKAIDEELLGIEQADIYKKKLINILRYIDDNIVLEQKSLWNEHKLFALMKKHEGDFQVATRKNEKFVRFGNTNCYDVSNCQFTIEFITLNETKCEMKGYTILYPFESSNIDIYVEVNGHKYKCESRFRNYDVCSLGEPILTYYGFSCTIPLERIQETYNIRFFVEIDGELIEKRNVHYKKYSPIGQEYKNSYYVSGGWKISPKGHWISICSCGRKGRIISEIEFLKELWRKDNEGSRKAVFARVAAHIAKLFKRRQIWLISDKANRADDNGEAFFVYLQKIKNPKIKSFFLIDRHSSDYGRLKRVGHVIPYMSWWHKFIYLISDYTISAYSHDEINNPFMGYFAAYRDLMQSCDYIFLQHGIIKDDLSLGTNKYHKNIKRFVCSAVPEHQSVVDTPTYGYEEDEVILTGLPRYDRLYRAERNEIVIMPTWRRHLFGDYHAQDSRWDLKPGFQNSAYYKFYNELLDNERLLKRAKQLGYEINFVPHPILFPYLDQFSVPEQVKLWGTEVVYRDMFARNKLLITDFSSVAFDFAYLRKPVVYAHFDANHYAEGYFDYERDGFGEVEYDLESTVDRIIEYMENGCQLKEKYRERIDNFFAFNDQNNCQRVYEKILELDKQR